MKVLESRSAFLSNYEVAVHLEELVALQDSLLAGGRFSTALESANLQTIQHEMKQYLDGERCQRLTEEKMTSLLKDLKSWELTKVEKLMILNQVPTNESELSTLIEEYADRFDEKQRRDLLAIISQISAPLQNGHNNAEGENVEAHESVVEDMAA